MVYCVETFISSVVSERATEKSITSKDQAFAPLK